MLGIYTLVEHLCREGLRPDVLALDGSATPNMADEFRALRLRVETLSLPRIGLARSAVRLAQYLRSNVYDVIHTTLLRPDILSAAIARYSRSVPTISTVRSRFDEELVFSHGRLRAAVISRVWRTALAAKSILIPHSEAIRENLVAAGLDPARMVLINNGVDTARFRPATGGEREQARAKLGLPREKTIILHCGHLTRLKGLNTLLGALSQVPEERELLFVSAGDGEDAASLRALTADLNLQERVIWLGYQHDMATLLQAADIYAMPSQTEGLSRAALEAGASGLPVIAADIPGFRTLIKDGESGLLVPPNDPDAWAGAVAVLARGAELRTKLAACLRKRVEESFSAASMVRQYLDIYIELAGGSGPDRRETTAPAQGIDRPMAAERLIS
jgi:glycosyltransferase involved in cell wall biosynthesis